MLRLRHLRSRHPLRRPCLRRHPRLRFLRTPRWRPRPLRPTHRRKLRLHRRKEPLRSRPTHRSRPMRRLCPPSRPCRPTECTPPSHRSCRRCSPRRSPTGHNHRGRTADPARTSRCAGNRSDRRTARRRTNPRFPRAATPPRSVRSRRTRRRSGIPSYRRSYRSCRRGSRATTSPDRGEQQKGEDAAWQ